MALNTVGIVCALASEARHLGPAVRRSEACATLADGTLLAVTGMGGEAAAAGARSLLDAGAKALASWGMAGGLDPALSAGTVLLPDEILGLDGKSLPTAALWKERLGQAVNRQLPIAHGLLLSSSRAVASVGEKAELFRATRAVAVDMESLAIALVATSGRMPFIAVRVIVDRATDNLPHAVTVAADRHGHIRIWQLLGKITASPRQLPALATLAWRYRVANRSLALIARQSPLARFAFPAAGDSGSATACDSRSA